MFTASNLREDMQKAMIRNLLAAQFMRQQTEQRKH